MFQIIFVAGYKRHGKDFFAALLNSHTNLEYFYEKIDGDISRAYPQYKRIVRLAFADELKRIYCKKNRISRQDFDKTKDQHRIKLYLLSKDIGLLYFTQWIFEAILQDQKVFMTSTTYVITDFRQPSEIHYFYERFGELQLNPQITTVRLFNQDIPIPDDPFERQLDNFPFDIKLYHRSKVIDIGYDPRSIIARPLSMNIID